MVQKLVLQTMGHLSTNRNTAVCVMSGWCVAAGLPLSFIDVRVHVSCVGTCVAYIIHIVWTVVCLSLNNLHRKRIIKASNLSIKRKI